MRAELVFMGKRFDMAPRIHRRLLVISIYIVMTALMASLWTVDRWRVTGVYMIFATILVNRLFLGGYNFGGLIKPFNSKAPNQSPAPPPFLMLALRVYHPEPPASEFRNDERELHQRDRAHYQAYQVLSLSLCVLWLLADWRIHAPHFLAWVPASADLMIYGLVLATTVVALTLPQSVLLWTEPDMETDFQQP